MTVKSALRVGLSFGLTSAVITTLGLMMGLFTSTQSRLAVIGGVLTIALADALSDALGIHVSQESQPEVSVKQVWLATLATFGAKLGFALTFVLPLVFFPLSTAIRINVIWGLVLLGILSGLVGKKQDGWAWRTMVEHLVIALAVLLISSQVGRLIQKFFS